MFIFYGLICKVGKIFFIGFFFNFIVRKRYIARIYFFEIKVGAFRFFLVFEILKVWFKRYFIGESNGKGG